MIEAPATNRLEINCRDYGSIDFRMSVPVPACPSKIAKKAASTRGAINEGESDPSWKDYGN